MKHCYIVIIVALLFPTVVFAGRIDEAREHYEKATSHFAVGEFSEAAAEYQAAFKAKPDPALLYNAAQAYRLANNPEKAIILYRNYLQLYPNEKNADEVRAQIDKLKEAIAAADKAKTSPPTGTNEPKQIKSTPDGSDSRATAAPTPGLTEQPTAHSVAARPRVEHRTPVYKKWWFWTAIGVVVAGGAVTAAVLATRPTGSWSNVPDVGPASSNGLAVRW